MSRHRETVEDTKKVGIIGMICDCPISILAYGSLVSYKFIVRPYHSLGVKYWYLSIPEDSEHPGAKFSLNSVNVVIETGRRKKNVLACLPLSFCHVCILCKIRMECQTYL